MPYKAFAATSSKTASAASKTATPSKTGATAAPSSSSDNLLASKYYGAGVAFHRKKDFKNALMYYNAAITKDRKYWQAWLGLGICYYSMAKYRNAKLIFQHVLTLKPDEPTARKYYDIMSPKKKKAAQVEVVNRSKGELMWRSALLPGLGQFYNGELAKGYIYSIGYVASVAAIIKYTIDQQTAVSAYNNANSDFDKKFKAAQDASNKVFIPIATAGAVWAVSVLDAFLSGKDDKPAPAKRTVEFRYDNGFEVALNLVQVAF